LVNAMNPSPNPLANTVKIELEVPHGAVPNDKLSFHTPAGQFSLTVPAGATPGKRMMVTMPVASNFPPNQKLAVSGMRINGVPIAPKLTPEQHSLHKEHKVRSDGHWNKYTPRERHEVRAHVELQDYRPAAEATITEHWGLWPVNRLMYQVDKARQWEVGVPHSICSQSFTFASREWELAVEGRAIPWRRPPPPGVAGKLDSEQMVDAELCVVLRRLARPSNDPNPDARRAFTVWTHLEMGHGDRWSPSWQRVTLSPGEVFEYDLGDRRRVGDLLRHHVDTAVALTLQLTTAQPAGTQK